MGGSSGRDGIVKVGAQGDCRTLESNICCHDPRAPMANPNKLSNGGKSVPRCHPLLREPDFFETGQWHAPQKRSLVFAQDVRRPKKWY